MSRPRQRANLSSLHMFALLGPSLDWMMSTHTDEGDLLSVTQSTSVFQKHPHRHT